MLLDSRALAVEGVVSSALQTLLAGAVQLAAACLTQDWRAQLAGGEAGREHCWRWCMGGDCMTRLREACNGGSGR